MSNVDPDGEWFLELDVAESDIRHVIESDEPSSDLRVSFTLHTHPGREFAGQVVDIQSTAEMRGSGTGVVVVRVAVNEAELPELRSGTTVNARILCSSRSIGYVWFRDLIETVQTEVLFWL